MVTVFMSSVGFKADEIAEMTADCKQFEDEVLSYLEEEGVVYYSKKSFTMGIFYDKSNHKLLSCNITVGVEDELYSEVSFPFWGLNHFDPVTDEFQEAKRMGSSVTIKCKECNYTKSFITGTGMMYSPQRLMDFESEFALLPDVIKSKKT